MDDQFGELRFLGSSFGPTVTLVGTLRSLNKDVFVKRMSVRVIRTQDKAEHTFTWRAFRPSAINLGAGGPQSLEIAGSFLVATGAPRQYNVFFASADFATQYQTHVQPLRDAWYAFLEDRLRQHDQTLAGQVARVLQNPALSGELFNEFIQAGRATALQTAISNGLFWHSGDYQIEFGIDMDVKPGMIIRRWAFALSPEEEQNFRLNIVTLIRELCYLPVVYNFAYKAYRAV